MLRLRVCQTHLLKDRCHGSCHGCCLRCFLRWLSCCHPWAINSLTGGPQAARLTVDCFRGRLLLLRLLLLLLLLLWLLLL